jgi:hypothetical protein
VKLEHSPLSNTVGKNESSYTPLPIHAFMTCIGAPLPLTLFGYNPGERLCLHPVMPQNGPSDIAHPLENTDRLLFILLYLRLWIDIFQYFIEYCLYQIHKC